jgi:iron complex transport system substrate-binding protein
MRTLLILLIFAALTIAGCGGDDEPSAAEAGAGFPVTIENKHGTVEISERPVRVVALDFPSADDAIALGVVPVGMAKVSYAPGGVQEWTRAALKGEQPELLDVDTGMPLERIAALRPDVILATNAVGLAESWDKLNRIAPVVAGLEGEGIDSWQDTALRIGRALGREDRARELVDEVEAKVAQARDDNPAFEGRTISFFNFFEGSPYVINTESDFSIRFLSELGFELPPAVAALRGEDGRAKISPERLDTLDADVIMGTSPTPDALTDFAQGRVFQSLDAYGRDAWLQIDLPPATSMAFPSLLSVPYGLDELVPRLAEAVE